MFLSIIVAPAFVVRPVNRLPSRRSTPQCTAPINHAAYGQRSCSIGPSAGVWMAPHGVVFSAGPVRRASSHLPATSLALVHTPSSPRALLSGSAQGGGGGSTRCSNGGLSVAGGSIPKCSFKPTGQCTRVRLHRSRRARMSRRKHSSCDPRAFASNDGLTANIEAADGKLRWARS